jgi:CRP/FNR family transcriptional regulator, cyclic AMP receptor protein
MFIIVEGEALVTTRPGRTTHLRSGDFFGEMSLLDGDPRSATVEATAPIRLLVLSRQAFRQLLDETPSLVHKIMHTLSQRLRQVERSAIDLDRKPANR